MLCSYVFAYVHLDLLQELGQKMFQNCLNNQKQSLNESIPLLIINYKREGVMCVCFGLRVHSYLRFIKHEL